LNFKCFIYKFFFKIWFKKYNLREIKIFSNEPTIKWNRKYKKNFGKKSSWIKWDTALESKLIGWQMKTEYILLKPTHTLFSTTRTCSWTAWQMASLTTKQTPCPRCWWDPASIGSLHHLYIAKIKVNSNIY
jgi:hypothetical protein